MPKRKITTLEAERGTSTVSSNLKVNDDAAVKRPVKRGRKDSSSNIAVATSKATNSDEAELETRTNIKDDADADESEPATAQDIIQAAARAPPVHSNILPLPWRGRLGYACLNTYLRTANPPVFSSRTCRIASILENRHPLRNPEEPAHPTKNRPDKTKPANLALGRAFLERLGKANAKDIAKMLRWNDKYGIKFLRLSSEMFPFASHEEYGYKLEPFVSEELAEAGRIAAELGHRLTTHPGQYTQLGSPRDSVIQGAIRDLEYHDELLSLLKLPPQQNRDAVMILHLGGAFGDKASAIERFKINYARLSASIKNRLVLENDDVVWSVHELLPLCEELNIPMVLDYHHNNIVFDASQIREGTQDIIDLYPRILATWRRKGITPKMHYSEPTPAAVTGHQRRKHNPRVATLPPCPNDMDLMIEAKDKEQAVFELMRNFKLPGFERVNDIIPHYRADENRVAKPLTKKAIASGQVPPKTEIISEEDISMGGPENRVYWPIGQEHWLSPAKRELNAKKVTGIKSDGESTTVGVSTVKSGSTSKSKLKDSTSTSTELSVAVSDEKQTGGKPARKKRVTMQPPSPSLTSEGEDGQSRDVTLDTGPSKPRRGRKASGININAEQTNTKRVSRSRRTIVDQD